MSKRFKQVFPIYNDVCMRYPETLAFETKLFDIDNVAAYWIHHDQWEFDMQKDFGPIRLPYPACWMEHTFHRNNEQQAGITDNGWLLMEFHPGSAKRTQLLSGYGAKDHSPENILIVASLFWSTPHVDDHAVLSWVTEEGRWITSVVHIPQGSALLKNLLDLGMSRDGSASELRAMFNPVALAIGLANCRNIDVPAMRTRDETRGKKRLRNKRPSTQYRVIRLPGAPSNRVDGPVQNAGQLRLHTVRGHFKTYTEDKPLYGKLTGTWWWNPAVRGNRNNGEIVSTYKQSPANAA